jgi:hypothetical protein
MVDDERCARIHEPLIGLHLGVQTSAVANVPERQVADRSRVADLRSDEHYFFSPKYADTWAPLLGRLMLQRFSTIVPSNARVCVVQEPNGSEGADLIMRALPRARLLFLMRDGRDVVDSILDSYSAGSWLDAAFGVGRELSPGERLEVMEAECFRWVTRTQAVQKAFDEHSSDLRLLVRYEELLSDTRGQLVRLLEWMNLSLPSDLDDRVARHSFNRIPKSMSGPGQFARAATPGLWTENWTPDEKRVCGEILDETLVRYGYEPTY